MNGDRRSMNFVERTLYSLIHVRVEQVTIMGTTVQDLESWVAVMMKKKNLSNYKLDLSGTSDKGDGYLGEIHFMKVDATKQDGTKAEYHIVVKCAKKNEEFRKKTPIQEAYQREIFMYTKVFPVFEEFQREYSVEEPFHKFPKYYSICSEDRKEAIILQNLKTAGYIIHDRTKPHNLNHALYVFRSYGQFHALSMAMRVKKPGLYNSLTKNLSDIMRRLITQTNMVDSFINDFNKGVETLRTAGKVEIARKFDGVDEEIRRALTNPAHPKDSHCVIVHGDCWNNNMMFKYEDDITSQPADLCYIDFQLSAKASPIWDLSYYLYSCCDKPVLQNFDFLLQAYYSSLSDHLKFFGVNAENIITYKELKGQWRKFAIMGMAIAPFILKLMLSESHEVVDFAESVELGTASEAFNISLENDDYHRRRLKDVFEHFGEKFL